MYHDSYAHVEGDCTMRWQKKAPWHPADDVGKGRLKRGFLIFPKCIANEWRWFETASWQQEWGYKWHNEDFTSYGWINKRWDS